MSNETITFDSHSIDDTYKLGALLERFIPDGAVVSLIGSLGTGKTTLVRAIAAAGGENPQDVSSPTFVLIQEYTAGRRPIYHFDAYRIADDDEFLELGPEEYFDSTGVTFVEWADRVINCLPESFIQISVEHISDSSRRYKISAIGSQYQNFLKILADNSNFL
ncbi:MAG: tRNA (adenosine(37)-N6)-threonylcarbamoyltransferase complex ATPase subunit type 1 TsaE [Thermoguttaceae bacterium]|nr:tRNA (adenosine(37)-N6)-threonylcarbamoyltransferase complex ATPase subunit type 1 TsaE [Thermoguttaceae bacterium]